MPTGRRFVPAAVLAVGSMLSRSRGRVATRAFAGSSARQRAARPHRMIRQRRCAQAPWLDAREVASAAASASCSVGIHAPRQRCGQPEPLQVALEALPDACEGEGHPLLTKFPDQFMLGLRGGLADGGDDAGVDHEPADRDRCASDQGRPPATRHAR